MNEFEDYDDFIRENYGKKIVVIYGNCHTTAIRRLLENNKSFNEKYAIYPIKAIQEVKNPLYFKGRPFMDCDIFIHQSIRRNNKYGEDFSSEKIMENLKDGVRIIAIPNLYHLPMCYFPQYQELMELKNENGKTLFFRDEIIERGVRMGKTVDEIIADYTTKSENPPDFRELYDTFINKVRSREADWDIKITDFLIENKNKQLFFDPNHPTPLVIEFITKELLKILNIDELEIDSSNNLILDSYQMPLCFDVLDYFNINYDYNGVMREGVCNKLLRGKMRLKGYIKQYISLMWTVDDIDDGIRNKSKYKYKMYKLYNVILRVLRVR